MKSTMMSSPLLLNSILERARTLFPDAEIVSIQPDGRRHCYMVVFEDGPAVEASELRARKKRTKKGD
jgi:hypothetical protein